MSTLDQIPNGWAAGVIIARNEGRQTPVAGWVKAPFGIDFRVVEGAEEIDAVWAVTHLASGYTAGAWVGSATDVMRLADQMAAAADWDFDTIAEMKVERASMQSIWDAYKGSDRIPGNVALYGAFA